MARNLLTDLIRSSSDETVSSTVQDMWSVLNKLDSDSKEYRDQRALLTKYFEQLISIRIIPAQVEVVYQEFKNYE